MEGVTIVSTPEWEAHKRDIANLTQLVKKLAQGTTDNLMTTIEVQDYLKKGSTWVDKNKHVIGCSKVGGEWRFRKSVVDAFINKSFFKNN